MSLSQLLSRILQEPLCKAPGTPSVAVCVNASAPGGRVSLDCQWCNRLVSGVTFTLGCKTGAAPRVSVTSTDPHPSLKKYPLFLYAHVVEEKLILLP